MANTRHMPNEPAFGKPVLEAPADRRNFAAGDFSALTEPIVLRGLIADWPAVAAARSSAEDLVSYLLKFDKGTIVPVTAGSASLNGRIFYNDAFTGMNVDRGNARLEDVVRRVLHYGAGVSPPLIYLASTDVDECMPGFSKENKLEFGELDPLASVWIGTKTRIAAHNDLPLNIACVVAGERRFTLFPPDQVTNLYIGPFELTPAGRPISLVDFSAPDLSRFPRFKDAMASAQIADLHPGDALFIPSMWWHHVESLGSFNFLLNYWWRTVPAYLGTPQDVLTHAMLTIRGLRPEERRAWREFFNFYVFDYEPGAHAHIPEHVRSVLAPMTKDKARQMRATILNRLTS